MQIVERKKQLVFLVTGILVVGFLTTSLVSYFVSLSSLREEITSSSLPLTSDNVYSEIQRDLILPVYISSLMANDTFLRDWVLDGEQNQAEITRYLKEIMTQYGTYTSFFVSDATRTYYHADGVLKQVNPDEPRDAWYFRVRGMESDYEINVDPDMANRDAMTIFINHKVYDYDGNYIGVTGVGMTVSSLSELMYDISERYGRNVYLTDTDGVIVLLSTCETGVECLNIRDIEGISDLADEILSTDDNIFQYMRQGNRVHLNSRFVSELNWYLLVEQTETASTGRAFNALVVNLILCALITVIVIAITMAALGAYEKITQRQHTELYDKNAELQQAMQQVRQLSGLLPICASCKRIRDAQGDWHQLESYIRDHSEADFSHGICPDCGKTLYGDLYVGSPSED